MTMNAEDMFKNFGNENKAPVDEFKAWEQKVTSKVDQGDDDNEDVCGCCGELESECICNDSEINEFGSDDSDKIDIKYKSEIEVIKEESITLAAEARALYQSSKVAANALFQKIEAFNNKVNDLNEKLGHYGDYCSELDGEIDIERFNSLIGEEFNEDFEYAVSELEEFTATCDNFVKETEFSQKKDDFSMFNTNVEPSVDNTQKKDDFSMFNTAEPKKSDDFAMFNDKEVATAGVSQETINPPSPSTPFYAGNSTNYPTPLVEAVVQPEVPKTPVDPFEEFAKRNGFQLNN